MLRLLGRPTSINVRKVIWTAAEANIALAREDDWALTRDVSSKEFKRLNPNGLIPVLVTPQGALWESNSICRYLAALAPNHGLLPVEPFQRAQAEKWMDWQQTELNNAWRAAFMALVRRDQAYVNEELAIKSSITKWNAMMQLLEQHMGDGRPYVTGTDFTLADIVLGLSHQRWLLTPFERPETAALTAWRERLLARPAAAALDWTCP